MEHQQKSIGIPLLSRQQMEMPFSVSVRPNVRPTSPSPSTSSLASVTSSEDGRFHPYKPNENNPEKNDIDLFTILNTSLKGSALVQYYHKYSQFHEEQRNVLIHVIAKHFDEMGVNLSLSNSYKIEKQILERFKNEKLEYYRCGKRGRIYNKYCNLKTSFGTAVDKYVKRKSPKMRQNGKRTEKVFEPEEDAAICLRSLTFDNLSAEEMDCTWKAFVNYRMDDIKKCATTEEILKKWPFYKAPTGFRLIDMDFQFAYKNGDGLLEKWPTCRDKIIQFLLANVTEKSCRILIQKTKKDENLNEDVINANTMLALHGYFIPTSKIVIKDESGRNVTTKYTIKDSQDSFIYRAKSLQEFEDYLDHLKVAKKSIQPFVFIIDEKETYVYFDNIRNIRTFMMYPARTRCHNQQIKDNIWEEIAKEMQKPVSECKKRWASLRDSFRKSLKSQETKSGQGSLKKRLWRFDKQMTFLRPFMANRKQISNVDDSDSSESERYEQENYHIEEDHVDNVASPASNASGSSISRPCSVDVSDKSKISTSRKSKLKSKTNLSTAEVLQNYLNEKSNRKHPAFESDSPAETITKFFDCMAATVKTLSPQLQIEVKSKIFGIVSDAETRNLNINSMNSRGEAFSTQIQQTSQFGQFCQANQVTRSQTQYQQHQQPFQLPPYSANLQQHVYRQPQATQDFSRYSQQQITTLPSSSDDYESVPNTDNNTSQC
ncbi:hypothetical protein FQR65_LT00010 [Abscondita terminalis]|nr:hypothetical protein FQR65_LT00010 [Abscondita terminalis]